MRCSIIFQVFELTMSLFLLDSSKSSFTKHFIRTLWQLKASDVGYFQWVRNRVSFKTDRNCVLSQAVTTITSHLQDS